MVNEMRHASMDSYAEFLIASRYLRNSATQRDLLNYADYIRKKHGLTPDESIRQAVDGREVMFQKLWEDA